METLTELAEQVAAAGAFIDDQWPERPRVGIVLGTGMSGLAQSIRPAAVLPYEAIPNFPQSTALGHQGELICGHLGSVPVLVMQGRFHLYEGYPPQIATLPIRVMKRLGVQTLILTNASGGLHPGFQSGDVMVLEDQLDLTWRSRFLGTSAASGGMRGCGVAAAFDDGLLARALEIGRGYGLDCHQGVYAGMLGPTYETRAEYRMLRRLGADVVGMSTVCEVVVAAQEGMRVVGLSAVTNLCRPDTLESTSGEEVKLAAERAGPRLQVIVEQLVAGGP